MFIQNDHKLTNSQRQLGTILVTSMLILMVVTLTAIVALSSSRQNLSSSGQVRNKFAASNSADTAIYLALNKIRQIPDWYTNTAAHGRLNTGYDPANMDPNVVMPNCGAKYTWTAADHNPATSLVAPDQVFNERCICNFLGSTFPDGYVSVCRQRSFGDPAESFPVQPYLVTAMVKSSTGMVVKQAAVLNPLTVYNLDAADNPNVEPYIAAVETLR